MNMRPIYPALYTALYTALHTALCALMLSIITPLAHAAVPEYDPSSGGCPESASAWSQALGEAQRDNQHSYTFFWLASGRSSNLIDVERARDYAARARLRSDQLLSCSGVPSGGRVALETERRAAMEQMRQLKGVLNESRETPVGSLPLFLSLTRQELFYNYYDDPRETAILNGIRGFLADYKGPLTRKLLEPYIIVSVCSLPRQALQGEESSSRAGPCARDLEVDSTLKAVARHYLNENSSAYVLTPIEEGRYFESLDTLRDDFVGFLDEGRALPEAQRGVLARIAQDYHIPKINVLMLREQDRVDGVSYFGVHFQTYHVVEGDVVKGDVVKGDVVKEARSHHPRALTVKGENKSYGLVYVDGFSEDVRSRKYSALLWLALFVLVAPLLWLWVIRRAFPDPYTQEVPLFFGPLFTAIGLGIAYLSTTLIGDLGITNTEYASFSKVCAYLGSLVAVQGALSFVVFNLLASKWSRLSAIFYNQDVVTMSLLSAGCGWIGLLIYYAELRGTLIDSLPLLGAHFGLVTLASLICGRSIFQYLKFKHTLSVTALTSSIVVFVLCELCALTWRPAYLVAACALLVFAYWAERSGQHVSASASDAQSEEGAPWISTLELERAIATWTREFDRHATSGLITTRWLSGHKGIGKTRLVERFREVICTRAELGEGEPLFAFYGQCRSDAEAERYLCPPFAEALKDHLGYKYFENPQKQLNQINQQINSHKLLGTLKPIQIFTELFGSLRGEDTQENLEMLEESVYKSFVELLQQRPVLFVIDQVHLIDPASRALLSGLITRLSEEGRGDEQRGAERHSLTFILIHQYENLSRVQRLQSELQTLLGRAKERHATQYSTQYWELISSSETRDQSQEQSKQRSSQRAHGRDTRQIKAPGVTNILTQLGMSYPHVINLFKETQLEDGQTPKLANALYDFYREHEPGLDWRRELNVWTRARLTDRLTDEVRERYEALALSAPDEGLDQLLLICAQLTMFTPEISPEVIQRVTQLGEWRVLSQLKMLYQGGWLTIVDGRYQLRDAMDHRLLLKYFESQAVNQPLILSIHVHQALHLFKHWRERGRSHQGRDALLLVTVFKHASFVWRDARVPFYEITREVTQVEPGRWGEEVFDASLHTLSAEQRGLLELTPDERSLLLSQYLWHLFNYDRSREERAAQLKSFFGAQSEELIASWLPAEGGPRSLEDTIERHLSVISEEAQDQEESPQTTRLRVAYQNYSYQKSRDPLNPDDLKRVASEREEEAGLPLQEAIVLFFQLAQVKTGFSALHMRALKRVTETLNARRDHSYPVWIYAGNHYAGRVKSQQLSAHMALVHEVVRRPASCSHRKRRALEGAIEDHKAAVELLSDLYHELSAQGGRYKLDSNESQYADALYDLAQRLLLNPEDHAGQTRGDVQDDADHCADEYPRHARSDKQRQALNELQVDLIERTLDEWSLYDELRSIAGLDQRSNAIAGLASPFARLIPICLASVELLKRSIQGAYRDGEIDWRLNQRYSQLGAVYVTYLEVLFKVVESSDPAQIDALRDQLELRVPFVYRDARDAYLYSLGLCDALNLDHRARAHQDDGLKRLDQIASAFERLFGLAIAGE